MRGLRRAAGDAVSDLECDHALTSLVIRDGVMWLTVCAIDSRTWIVTWSNVPPAADPIEEGKEER